MFGSEISFIPNEESSFPNRKIITKVYFFNKSYCFPDFFGGNGKIKVLKTRTAIGKLGQEFA